MLSGRRQGLELRDVVQDPLTGAFGALLQLEMPLMVPGVQFCNSSSLL